MSALERSVRALENVSLKESNKRLKNGGHQIQVYISGRSISVSNSVKKNDWRTTGTDSKVSVLVNTLSQRRPLKRDDFKWFPAGENRQNMLVRRLTTALLVAFGEWGCDGYYSYFILYSDFRLILAQCSLFLSILSVCLAVSLLIPYNAYSGLKTYWLTWFSNNLLFFLIAQLWTK